MPFGKRIDFWNKLIPINTTAASVFSIPPILVEFVVAVFYSARQVW